MNILLIIAGIIILLIGIFGAILPFLPGLPMAFMGVLLLSFATDFKIISIPILIVLACLALLSVIIVTVAGFLGAKLGKASIWGMIGTVAGLIVGSLSFGFAGMVIGPAVGAIAFEFTAKRDRKKASRVAKSTLATSLLGLAVNGILAVIYAIVIVIAVVF